MAGCVSRVERLPEVVPPQRVLFVVLAGDNNLSEEVEWRLKALQKGWQSGMGPLFVLVDSKASNTPELLRLVCDDRGGRRLATVATFESIENSASEALWRSAFAHVEERIHPDAGIGLVVFSHGSGWLPEGMLAAPRSFVEDKGREMSLEVLVGSLPEGRIDYILFDMCFTAGVEVAYALQEKAPLLLVSSAEMLSPGFTQLYASSLKLLYGKQPTGLIRWAEQYAAVVESQEGLYRSGTLSVIDTGVLEGLANALRGLQMPNTYAGLQRYDRGSGAPLFYDLGELIALQAEPMKSSAKGWLERAVLYEWHTPTFMGFLPIHTHSGLTTYLPTEAYPQLNLAYQQTAWWQALHR